MGKTKLGLLFGGNSGEHEVSIISAKAIASALNQDINATKYEVIPFYIDKQGRWHEPNVAREILELGKSLDLEDEKLDLWQFPQSLNEIEIFFPILHGPNGEDGTIQGLLTLMQVPFVGSGVLGSSVGMDKIAMKTAFTQAGLPQVKYYETSRSEVWSSPCVFPKLCDDIEAELEYPCFVKPANLGSSVGISKVRSRSELESALDKAANFDRRIIIEEGVIAREVECAVLGNDNPRASTVGEISFASDFYDYETKYTSGMADLYIPAKISNTVVEQIQEMALKAFAAVDAAGLARVDFFYVEATEEVFINEINTLPGFTSTSMYPQLWKASGIEFPQLVDKLIILAEERYKQ